MICELQGWNLEELNELIEKHGIVQGQIINIHRKKDGQLVLYYFKML